MASSSTTSEAWLASDPARLCLLPFSAILFWSKQKQKQFFFKKVGSKNYSAHDSSAKERMK
jgi:hypothetical protein